MFTLILGLNDFAKKSNCNFIYQYCDCDLICNYFLKLFQLLYSMTNTILDRLNINVIFCKPGLYVTMKLGDA